MIYSILTVFNIVSTEETPANANSAERYVSENNRQFLMSYVVACKEVWILYILERLKYKL